MTRPGPPILAATPSVSRAAQMTLTPDRRVVQWAATGGSPLLGVLKVSGVPQIPGVLRVASPRGQALAPGVQTGSRTSSSGG